MMITIAGSRAAAPRVVDRILLPAAAQLCCRAELEPFDLLDRVPPFNEDWEADPAPLAVSPGW